MGEDTWKNRDDDDDVTIACEIETASVIAKIT